MRADEFASLIPGGLGNFEHALFIGGLTGSLTAHVANTITGSLTVCDFDNARLSELKQLRGLSKPINTRHVLPVPAGSADITTAYSCSEAMHSSLACPAMIMEKMPGLTFSETQISTSSVDKLVSEMGLNDALSNLLVISVNGFEELWLDPEVELLRYFDVVLVRLPFAGWFDTAVQGDQLLANLALPGIALPFGSLPYRWWMIRRPMGWGAQQRAAQEASNKFLEKVEELEQAIERTAALEAKLSDQAEMIDAQQESLALKEHDLEQATGRIAALEVDLSFAQEQAEAGEAQITLLNSDLTDSLRVRSSLDDDISELRRTAEDLEARLKQQTQWHYDNKNRAESLNEKLHAVEKEKWEQIEIASLAQKMLAKSQGDLEVLRNKYEQKVISERDLMNLISELRQKLTAASQYYFRLQQAHPELLAPPRSRHEY